MGTTQYFREEVKDSASDETFTLETGTSTFAGEGAQMYLNIDDKSILLSHEDAEAFIQKLTDMARYLGYNTGG